MSGDMLDWLHARARRRDGKVPELDVERTLDRVRAARDAEPGAVNFWQALSPTEQAAFAEVARERAFPAGAALMRQGEPAGDVTVILDGWTMVTVDGEDVAQRGPGQLVGERGAAPGRVRSATVTALEPVRALVVGTADFAAFVGAHPSVLDIVDKQVYGR
jgi:CRP-like cAMP-binding protein